MRERLDELASAEAKPHFEGSTDATLVSFAEIFTESGLAAFDANKHLRQDAFSPIYDCETESRRPADAEVEMLAVTWAPVWHHDNPVSGFRTGADSAFVGSTPTVAMPQDERTAALLLLVTTTFVHLSGSLEGELPLIRGAAEAEDGTFRFVELHHSPDAAADRVAARVAPATSDRR